MSRIGENIRKSRESAGLTPKALAKKLGLSEAFILEVESGRKIPGEAHLERMAKILGKNVNSMGLGAQEAQTQISQPEVKRPAGKPLRPAPQEKKPAPVNKDLWDAAFGSNLKNVPVYRGNLSKAVGQEMYPVEGGKVRGIASDKALLFETTQDDLIGYGIPKGSRLLGAPQKECSHHGYYLLEVKGKPMLRRVQILGNGNLLFYTFRDREITQSVPAKEAKVLAFFTEVTRKLTY